MTSSKTARVRFASVIAACAVGSGVGCAGVLGLDDFTEAGSGGGSGVTGSTTVTGSTADTAATSTADAASTGTSGDGGSSVDSSSATGDGGAGGSGDGGGGAGQGGAGGAGGGPLEITCTAGDDFTVFTSLELGGAAVDDERLIVVSRPNSNRVHVAVATEDGTIVARTVRTSAVPDLSPVVTFPEEGDSLYRRILGGYVADQTAIFWGDQGGSFGEFVFPADEEIGNTNVVFRPFPTPSGCIDLRGAALQQGEDGVVRFAAACTSAAAPVGFLYVGTPDAVEFSIGPVDLVDGELPEDMLVRGYGYVDGQHVIFTGNDEFTPDDGGFVRVGATREEVESQVYAVTPPVGHGLAFIVGPTFDAEMFLAALHVDPDSLGSGNVDGTYRTGGITPDDAANVADDVVATLPHGLDFSDPSKVAVPFSVQRAGEFVVGAAVSAFSLDEADVTRLYLWQPDGTILVEGFPVAEAPDGVQFLAAGAAAAGFGTLAVGWSEVVGGAYRVRGAPAQCLAR